MTKKPVWLLESNGYQYENFKKIIEYSGWDVFTFYKINKIDQKNRSFFDMDKNEIDPETLKDKYSVIIKTGSGRLPRHIDILQIAETRKIIQIPHSIIGFTVDIFAAMPATNFKTLYGLYPEVWMNISSVQERYQSLVDKGKTSNVFPSKTHPYMAKVLEPLHSDIEKGSLGILMSNAGGPGPFVKLMVEGLKKRPKYKKIYVKRHPLSETMSTSIFKPLLEYCDELEVIKSSSDKNKFFDRCETLCIGMSSTFVESNLRCTHYNRPQFIYGVNENNRNGRTDFRFSEQGLEFNDWSETKDYKPWSQYNDLLSITDENAIYDEYINSLQNIIETINTSLIEKE